MPLLLDAARSLVASRRAARRVGTPDRLRPLDFSPLDAALVDVSPEDARRVDDVVAGADIASLARSLESGEVSSRDLVLRHLTRIRHLDDRLRTIIELNPSALVEAQESDERRAAGASRGPLDGIPLTVKNNIATAAPLHTVNPHGADFSPGGSSSGTAAAVEAGLTVVGIGTETSGSLISPASFHGVVGMKPTHGLVPGEGIIPLLATQDDAGPVARTVPTRPRCSRP